MFYKIFVIFVTTVMVTQVIEVDGARILGIFPAAAPSHYILGHRLMKELALRGHEVTFINAFGQKKPMKNYKDIVLSGFDADMDEIKKTLLANLDKSPVGAILQLTSMTSLITESTFNASGVLELLKSDQKFDLVLMETFLTDAHVVFAHHYDTPLVILSTIGASSFVNHYSRNPAPSSYCTEMLIGVAGKLSFFDRLKNTLFSSFMDFMIVGFHISNQNKIMHKFFPEAPHILDIIKKRTSIVLLNSHPSISQAKPTVPNMIEIGGYHVEDAKELPKDLKEYLDSAKEGFILFSLGSNIKSTMISLEKRNILMKAFEKLPYKILWKFEDENLPGKPNNVKIGKWLPQNDILAHPNIKLFITHGGLLSTTEATYHGVPVVGIPIFGDQKMNMATVKRLKIGEFVEFTQLNYEDLWNALQKVLTDKIYADNARARSKVMRDQPMKPIDTAMFWIEYAIRHKYANHLKTAAMDLEWWEFMNLDVLAVLGGSVIFVVYIFYWVLKKLCCSKKEKKYPQEKKKKQA